MSGVSAVRILFLNTLFAPHVGGGAEVMVMEQAHGLQAAGHTVAVAALGPEAGTQQAIIDGIPVYRVGQQNRYFHFGPHRPPMVERLLWHWRDRDNPAIEAPLREVLRDFRPDVVSCHNLAGWSIAAWRIIHSEGITIVQVLHDQYLLCAKSTMFRGNHVCQRQCLDCRVLRSQHRQASAMVDGVVGVSSFILDKLVGNGYFQNARVRETILNARSGGLPLSHVTQPHRNYTGIRFGFIGTLAPNKGIELLLAAFTKLNLPDAELLIAGRGSSDYESSLRTDYNHTSIKFLGYVKPAEFFPLIDMSVVPSLWNDTLPGVVFESLGFGVPVIGSMRGGIPEMIVQGQNGFLFDPDRHGALENLLSMVAGKPDILDDMRKAAVQSAGRFFDYHGWIVRYEALYRTLCP